jgi:hypothetical protein
VRNNLSFSWFILSHYQYFRVNGGQLINNEMKRIMVYSRYILAFVWTDRKTIKTQSRQEVFQPIFNTASLVYKSKALLLHQST